MKHVLDARRRLAAEPSDQRLASNLANALWLEDQLADALSWARWATRGSAVHPLAWRCLGNVLLDCGCYEAAEAAYRRSDPHEQDPACQFNRSKVALGLAEYAKAWQLAEQRFRRQRLPDGALPGLYWLCWPDVDEVTIWCEQGLGDTLQYVRWLPALLARGCRVRLLVQPPLLRLLQRGLAWMGPALEVDVLTAPELLGPRGCHGSLLSLPWRLHEPVPPWPLTGGYLRLDPPVRASRARLRVGVMWGGGPQQDGYLRERDYRRKSVVGSALRHLIEGLSARSLDLVRLQVGPDRDPAELSAVVWVGQLNPRADLLDLASELQQLDLLLTVDTAAAHLAGAMGLPAWVLLPWAAASRWGRGTTRSPWYPSLRLWRQPRHGDWDGLWPAVLNAIDALL